MQEQEERTEGDESYSEDEKEYEVFYDYREIKETRKKQIQNVFEDVINKQIQFVNENQDIKDTNKFNIEEWAPQEHKVIDHEGRKSKKL